ncbi:MAG TPA: GNAT family N-acetyltransferase [Thermodesulfobacteriota bacterium]|nr:GNAT family N-acetyltransferase [Thermodesulfobacteriota bacterium]
MKGKLGKEFHDPPRGRPPGASARSGKIRIRNARPGDLEKIREVTISAFLQYASRMPDRWEDYRQNIVETLAEAKITELIVAEQDGVLVGSVVLYPPGSPSSPEAPQVRLLAVVPSARGKGVGAALMRQCIRRAKKKGAEVLALHTTDLMSVAMHMYEKMGFTRAPDLDFRVENVVVKGYRFKLGNPSA